MTQIFIWMQGKVYAVNTHTPHSEISSAVWILKKKKEQNISRCRRVKILSESMERLLYSEDNTASFPSVSRGKQFTFLMAWCHVHSAIVQKVRLTPTWKSQRKAGLAELLQNKYEQSASTWSKSPFTDKEEHGNSSLAVDLAYIAQICSLMWHYLLLYCI